MLFVLGTAFERIVIFMLRFFTVLLLVGMVFGGRDAGRICITDSGVAFGGHMAAGACHADAHAGLMALADTVGNCDDCVDVAVNDVNQRQVQDVMRDLLLAPVWFELPLFSELLGIVFAPRVETFYDTVAASACVNFFSPLETIVLRM